MTPINLSTLYPQEDTSTIGTDSILNQSTFYSSNNAEVNLTLLQLSRERTTPYVQLDNSEGRTN
jgi:hypothetical protein